MQLGDPGGRAEYNSAIPGEGPSTTRRSRGKGRVQLGDPGRPCRVQLGAPGESGFTLIEVLIAFTLTGIILVLLFSALHLATSSWDVSESRAEASTDLRVVQGFLRRKLRQARALAWHPKGRPTDLKMFVGDSHSIRFVGAPPGFLGPRGLHVLSLELQRSYGEGATLVLTWQPYRREMPRRRVKDEDTAVVAENIQELRFSFFGTDRERGEPSWRDRWEDGKWLPSLVRVEIRKDDQDWPELIVALHQ